MNLLFAAQLRPFVLLAVAASLLLNLCMLVPSIYMLQVFDRVFASRSVETLAMLSLFALLTLALAYCMDTARARALAFAGRALDARLSPAALSNALRHAPGRDRADAADRLRDVAQLRNFLGGSGAMALFDAPWLPIYLLVIGLMHPLLGVTAALGAASLALLAVLTERFTRDSAQAALRDSRLVSHHTEALTRNAEVIAAMGMGGAAVRAWQAGHDQLLDAQARLGASSVRFAALARTARQGLQIAALGIGAWLVIDANASPGIMVAATILIGRALQPVEHLIGGWKQLLDARGAWQRLSERRLPADAGTRLELPAPQGQLAVERVMVVPAAGRPALIKNVAFALDAGESLGIVGPSGSGKTTLARVLLGLTRPASGCVRLDGADIASWERDALGRHLGYLPQDVSLFAGTVAQNIARLAAVDPAAVVEAAMLAQAHEMILRLPEGYDTQVGEGGAVLSGGQRQRIALARALHGNPKLVVLDEPNAHLDAAGEVALTAALQALKARRTTVIVVAHRPALMAHLDKLAVLKDGALEAFGSSASVLARLRPQAVRQLPVRAPKEAVA